MLEKINETAKYIKSKINGTPSIGIILGTGLGGLAKEITVERSFDYSEIPNFPVSTVQGHSGQLIIGHLGNKKIVAMKGRFHYYEGYSMEQVTFPVRVMKFLGIEQLIISNASGGINPNFKVGDLMLINDHINLFGTNPLIGSNIESLGTRFPDMSQAYDKKMIELAETIATEKQIPVEKGVYAGVTGPTFETPAEYLYIRNVGADAVGMSTVPEVIVARHMSIQVFGISIITDSGVPGQIEEVSHEEVQEVAAKQEPKMTLIIKTLIERM